MDLIRRETEKLRYREITGVNSKQKQHKRKEKRDFIRNRPFMQTDRQRGRRNER